MKTRRKSLVDCDQDTGNKKARVQGATFDPVRCKLIRSTESIVL